VTTLELDDPELQPVTLGLEQRRTLGASAVGPLAIEDRIALGQPVCQALDLATVDAEARDFLDGRPESSFWLLALTCSFRALADEPIETAWLQVQLMATTPPGAADPLAWSMEPLSLTDPVQVSRSAKLDATLKLRSDTIPIEIGPSVGRESTETYARRIPFVEAHSEGTARPSWIFTRTEVTEVRGVHRLRAVVELPAGATGKAEVSAGATLRLKALGLLPFHAQLKDLPDSQSVQLGP
jgi:hypothetical protein